MFLSVIYQNNRLGCAFYDTKSCVLRITEVHEDTNWSLLQLSASIDLFNTESYSQAGGESYTDHNDKQGGQCVS